MSATPTPPAPTTLDSSPGVFNSNPAGPAPTDVASALPETKPAIADRLAEWKLTPDDIRSELAQSGQVVRSRAAGAGEPTGPMDTNLVSQINDSLKADLDTAALDIVVEAGHGVITLDGSARSLAQIGKAIAIALDTGGVTQTISRIKLEPTP